MDENPAPAGPETPSAQEEKPFGDLLTESGSSRKLKAGILTLALIVAAWAATWIVFKSLLFGWIPALIIIGLVRTFFQDKPRRINSSRPRRR